MNKLVIRCNKNEKQRVSQIINKRSKIDTKRVDCFFKILNKNNKWILKKIEKLKHNHVNVNEISHSMFRRYNITKQIKINIKQKYVFMRKSNEIFIFLYVKYNTNFNNSQIIIKNVHNFIIEIRKKKLSNKISIQILYQIFMIDSNWFAKFQLNKFIDEIKYLFFINKISTKILTTNDEICILDCIYKTNKYKMSLIIMTKIINFNISYYASMCFIKNEKHENYCWFLKIIKKLYQKVDISFSFVWLFDDKSNIVIVFAIEISSNAKHTLCVWYIEKNVINNCKKYFKNIVLWNKFMSNKKLNIENDFQRSLFVIIKIEFDTIWENLQMNCNVINEIIYKKKWFKVWTNELLHFNNHVFSRFEKNHTMLKSNLENFIENLNIVIKKTILIYNRQRNKYVKTLNIAKQRFFNEFNKTIFRDLITFVILFTFKRVLKQYDLLLKTQNIDISRFNFTNIFKKIINLSCSHIIEKRLFNVANEKILKFSNVHFHWRFVKFVRHFVKSTRLEIESKFVHIDENDSIHDSLLNIQNFKIIKTKSRFKKTLNKLKLTNRDCATKRQRIFENFIRRESFDFEYSEIIDLTFDVQISFNQFFCTLYSKFIFQSFSMILYFRFSFEFQFSFEFSFFV